MFPNLILLHQGQGFVAPDLCMGVRGLRLLKSDRTSEVQGEGCIKYLGHFHVLCHQSPCPISCLFPVLLLLLIYLQSLCCCPSFPRFHFSILNEVFNLKTATSHLLFHSLEATKFNSYFPLHTVGIHGALINTLIAAFLRTSWGRGITANAPCSCATSEALDCLKRAEKAIGKLIIYTRRQRQWKPGLSPDS